MDERNLDRRIAHALEQYAQQVERRFDAQEIVDRSRRPSPRRRFTAAISALGLVAVALALANLGPQRGAPSATPSTARGSEAASSSPIAAAPVRVATVVAPVSDIVYDPTTDAIWFAAFGPGAGWADRLYRASAADAQVDHWDLPDGLGNGFISEIEIGSDGAVWVFEGYRLFRFDAATEQTSVVELEVSVPGVGDGGDGTWISGIAVEGEHVWVSRHNVPWLTRFDRSMVETQRLAIEVAGDATDVATLDGRFFLAMPMGEDPAMEAEVVIVDASGVAAGTARVATTDLDVAGDRLLAHASQGVRGPVAWVESDGSIAYVSTEPVGVAGAGNDHVAWYNDPPGPGPAVLSVVDAAGRASTLVTFEKHPAELERCPIPAGSAPVGSAQSCPTIWTGAPVLGGLVIDARGTVWYVTDAGDHGELWSVGAPR